MASPPIPSENTRAYAGGEKGAHSQMPTIFRLYKEQVARESAMLEMGAAKSDFTKIVLEAANNTLNRWIVGKPKDQK